MPFELNQLRYALCVSRQGSFGRAADVLGTSETMVENIVSALETRVGLTLFEPEGDTLRPTAHGEEFLQDAEHLLWRADQVSLRLADARSAARDDAARVRPHQNLGEPRSFVEALPPGGGRMHLVPSCSGPPDLPQVDPTQRYVDLCRAILAAHKRAGRAFGNDLISDPASEMLLDLYVREHEGLTTSITCFWGAASSALGTARRSLTMMERRGFVVRTGDPSDGRRALVKLTPSAREQLEECFEVILCSAALSVDEVARGVPSRSVA